MHLSARTDGVSRRPKKGDSERTWWSYSGASARSLGEYTNEIDDEELCSRLHSSDGGMFISLVAVIVLLAAVGGVKLNHVVAADMLRTEV